MKSHKKIKRQLLAIAKGAENHAPAWVIIDRFTIKLLRDAVKAIEHLEKNR